MESKKIGADILQKIQKLGCKISIDDFGTGYSSLAVLKEFSVDKLKIDKSFIDDITENVADRTIVKASIAMARAMGMEIIAEGVETTGQRRLVQMLGCHEMQGFLFSKPKRADEIVALLKKHTNQKRKTKKNRK